jgi:tripartite-type tricarboxylate transporter receptor subunit TctC
MGVSRRLLTKPVDEIETTMTLSRRQFALLGTSVTALSIVGRRAEAQSYPSRPVRIIVGFPPGGVGDILARLMGQWLSERLGQPFIIENRPGAGSNIGTEVAVRAPADGYTLLLATTPNAINVTLYDKLNFAFTRDVRPVAGIMRGPNVMVLNPSVPAETLREFIVYAKANPDALNMASGGNGSTQHVAGELFKMTTGVSMRHVPYRGGVAALADLISGRVHVMFDNLPTSIETIRTGKLRALAVTTAARSEALPAVPTVSEFVPGYEASAWWGIGAPKNTPPDIVDKLNKEINAALADSKMRARLADLGGTVLPGAPADFGKLIGAEVEKWAEVVKFSGAKPD